MILRQLQPWESPTSQVPPYLFRHAHDRVPRLLTTTQLKLKNPDLFRDKAYVNGEWIEAKSGKRFDVIGELGTCLHG